MEAPKQSWPSLVLAQGKASQGEEGRGKAARWSFFPILVVEAVVEPAAVSRTFLSRCRSVSSVPTGTEGLGEPCAESLPRRAGTVEGVGTVWREKSQKERHKHPGDLL